MTVYAPPGIDRTRSVTVQSRATATSSAATGSSRRRAQYFENISPVNGKAFTEVGRGTAEDIEAALDAAHAAAPRVGQDLARPSASLILNRIADRLEENLEMLAVAETWENGKAVRETLAADLPLAVDHFRYFAGRAARPGGHELARSTRTPWPTTSTSRSASSARSSRGTSRS